MIKRYPNAEAAVAVTIPDPYMDRLAELSRMPPQERIAAIESDLKPLASLVTDAATFFRKKLMRLHDMARLEAGIVTNEELHRENSFSHRDFTQAKLNWRPRPRVHA